MSQTVLIRNTPVESRLAIHRMNLRSDNAHAIRSHHQRFHDIAAALLRNRCDEIRIALCVADEFLEFLSVLRCVNFRHVSRGHVMNDGDLQGISKTKSPAPDQDLRRGWNPSNTQD